MAFDGGDGRLARVEGAEAERPVLAVVEGAERLRVGEVRARAEDAAFPGDDEDEARRVVREGRDGVMDGLRGGRIDRVATLRLRQGQGGDGAWPWTAFLWERTTVDLVA